MRIVQATPEYLDQTAQLFDLYRQFYLQEKSIAQATHFIRERLEKQDSTIYLALTENNAGMGFTQLYPTFTSVAMQRTYILNDLFVAEPYRKQGVARALMNTAKAFAEKNKAHGIKLATAKSNIAAKSLYEELGYKQITLYDHYTLKTK